MSIALKVDPATGDLKQIQTAESLQADSFERLAGSGNLVVGSTLSGSEELQLGSTAALIRSMGDVQVDGIIDLAEYVEFTDMTAPGAPGAGLGRLYKKTGNDGVFWMPDAAGPEVDLTSTAAVAYDNTITVAKSGGDYTTIQGAIDSITDNSESNRYVILVYPGVYSESVVMEEYVSLYGCGGRDVVEVEVANATALTGPAGTSAALATGMTFRCSPTDDSGVCVALNNVNSFLTLRECYLELLSASSGVEGKLVDLDAGYLIITGTRFVYDLDGTAGPVSTHDIFDLAGAGSFYMTGSSVTVNIADANDTVNVFNEVSGATNIFHCGHTDIRVFTEDASYSGTTTLFNLNGSYNDHGVIGNLIRVVSSGNGTAYALAVDSSAGGAVIESSGNQYHIEGFTNNYSFNVATGDTINSLFDYVEAASGDAGGAGTLNVVNSDTLGWLNASAGVEIESGAPIIRINETDAGSDEKVWDVQSVAGDLKISTLTDALGAGNDAIVITRTGTTVDAIDAFADIDLNSNNLDNVGSHSYRTLQTDSSSSGTVTFDWSTDNKLQITLTEDITGVTFTAPPGPCNIVLKIIQGTAPQTVTGWPAAVNWPGGTAPTISVGNGDVDILTFFFDGTNYYGGFLQDFS